MKGKKILISVVLLGFVFSLSLSPSLALTQQKDKGKKDEKKETKAEERKTIPAEIQAILQQGLASRVERQDIKGTILKHLFLPGMLGSGNVYSVFLVKMKNADLGFMPSIVQQSEEEKKETETQPTQLQTALNVFLQFYVVKDKKPEKLFKEVYIPVFLQEESSTYNSEKEELYTINYLLPPGNYLLAMAVTSFRTQKIGTFYYEFSLPDMFAPFPELSTTPIFFAKNIEQIPSPEMTSEVHKNFFNWSILHIEPIVDNVIFPKDNNEIIYFISGAQVSETGRPNLTITYEVLQGGDKAIIWLPLTYNAPFVEWPFQLKQTVIIKQDGKEIGKETRDLKPGQYTLSMNIKDNISGKSLLKTVDFEVR